MICKNCGALLPDDSVFCSNCGAPTAAPAEETRAEAPAAEQYQQPGQYQQYQQPTEQQYQQQYAQQAQQQYAQPAQQQYRQYQQPYAQQAAPKKKNKALPWIIVAAVLLVAIGVTLFFVLANPFAKKDGGDDAGTDTAGTVVSDKPAETETGKPADTEKPEPPKAEFPAANVNDRTLDRVCDPSGVLTGSEKEDLTGKIADFVSTYGMDLLVLITDDEAGSESGYAEYYYGDKGYGCGESSSGIVYHLDFNAMEWNFLTFGDAGEVFDEDATYTVTYGNDVPDDLEEGDYYAACSGLVANCAEYARAYFSGELPIDDPGDGEWVYEGSKTFDADGNFIRYVKITFDDNGFVVSEEYSDNGTITKTVYENDAYGNHVKEYYYDSDGSLSTYYTVTYDADGNPLSDSCYGGDGTYYGSTSYVYDADGNLLRETDYNADGSLSYVYESKYDGNGNETEYTVTNDLGECDYRYVFTYDADGNPTGYTYYDGYGSAVTVGKYETDADGNVTKEALFNSAGELIYVYHYSYDEYGNEIKSSTFTPDGNLVERTEYRWRLVG